MSMRARPALFSFLTLAIFGLCPGLAGAQPTPPDNGGIRAEPEVLHVEIDGHGRPRPAIRRASHAKALGLERPTSEEIAQRISPPRKGAPLQIAFGRDVGATASEAALRAQLEWQPLPDGGQVAALAFSSPGASALRIGMRIVGVPPGAIFRFQAANGAEMFETDGAEMIDTIARNLEADGSSDEARTYWSPLIDGDTLRLEIELPSDARPQNLRIAIPQLSHFVATPREQLAEKASSSCQLDATCYSSTWGSESNAVARMVFNVGGLGYQCTGTLLSDTDTSTTIPYFLSANHCISTQTVASTLQTYWFYRSPSCNSGTYNATTRSGGATLHYATQDTDTSFMQLNTSPPAGVTFAGWLVGSIPALNAAMTGLHHPKGDPLKISFASLWAYARCFPSGTNSFDCDTSSSGTATFYGVLWNSGLTESGSSGSGIFVNNGHYLVGQLYGGTSACGTSQGPDFYGRFDVAYNAGGLGRWLSPSVRTLSVSKSGIGSGTVTSSPAGISCGSTCSASYSQNASVTLTATPSGSSMFSGWSGACSGTGSCVVTMGSDVSVTASFTDPALTPGAPTNLAATAGSGQATFTFSPPTNTGGSAIVRYTVTCTSGQTASAAASPIVVSGLQNGLTYTCSATATNATTTGPASGAVSVTPVSAPPALVSVVSRKTHISTTYDLPIDATKPVTGAITVEPRADNTHRIVFRFNNPVTSAGVVTVTDKAGAAIGSATVTTAGSEVTVTLTGVDGKRVRISLNGVNSTLNTGASVGFLTGDVDSSGAISASDILRIRGRQGAPLSTTFAYDDDLDAQVNNIDLINAKARAGSSLQ
jgi:hypothetical protein